MRITGAGERLVFEPMDFAGAEPKLDINLREEYGLAEAPAEGLLDEKETMDLVRYYYRLDEEPRRRLLDLARALSNEG